MKCFACLMFALGILKIFPPQQGTAVHGFPGALGESSDCVLILQCELSCWYVRLLPKSLLMCHFSLLVSVSSSCGLLKWKKKVCQ